MTVLDRFYTPPALARRVVQSARVASPSYVSDFAAGDGALLRFAAVTWPKSTIVATDIHPANVASLRRHCRSWRVARCDFLNPFSRRACPLLVKMRGRASLVVLNPPFSCRGTQAFPVNVFGERITCSRAMAFLLLAIPFLDSGGRIVAILPAGCAASQKDRLAWKVLRSLCYCETLFENEPTTFPANHARSIVIRATRLARPRFTALSRSGVPTPERRVPVKCIVKISRGQIQMHDAKRARLRTALPLIHTTNLQKGRALFSSLRVKPTLPSVVGPLVLLPRVGEPNKSKVALYLGRRPVVLSDCVLALHCRAARLAREVRQLLLLNWSAMEKKYRGTCAKYITLESLAELLRTLGVQVVARPNKGSRRFDVK